MQAYTLLLILAGGVILLIAWSYYSTLLTHRYVEIVSKEPKEEE